ncbi:MAG: amino acid ABC transporter substrate-binding protein [Christensenellales bacterium]
MKRIVSLMLTVIMLLCSCVAFADVATDDSYQKILDKGNLIMGLDDSFPPMGYRDENGDIVGFDVDVAREVCSRMGVELVLQPISWDAKVIELNSGNIDCIWNGFTITDELQEQLTFSEPYLANTQIIVVRNDSDAQTLSDLAGKSLGVQAGSSAVAALDANPDFRDSVTVNEFKDNMTAMLDLENGGLDAVLVDVIVAGYYFSQHDCDLRQLDESLAAEEYGVGFRKDDLALVENVNRILNEMAEDGTLAEISTKWFDSDITTVGKTDAADDATAA